MSKNGMYGGGGVGGETMHDEFITDQQQLVAHKNRTPRDELIKPKEIFLTRINVQKIWEYALDGTYRTHNH